MHVLRVLLFPLQELAFFISWILWLCSSITFASGQTVVVLFTIGRIIICIILYFWVVAMRHVALIAATVSTAMLRVTAKARHATASKQALLHALHTSPTLSHYERTAQSLDRVTGHQEVWKSTLASPDYDYRMLQHQLQQLNQLRHANDVGALMYTLQSHFHRSFCGLDSPRLYRTSYWGTKVAVEEYLSRLVEMLHFICQTEFTHYTLKHKIRFFSRFRKSYGRTALCLSGGGAFAMYHMGVVRALVQGNCLPGVINGTSGGSIVAGILATRTDAELRDPNFLTDTIANRYGVRWLPTLQAQVRHFMHHRVLMSASDFERTAKVYYGELTFEEAYRRTQRDVSITVTYSSSRSGRKAHALVLNHITSPHVLVWSAVTTSCALPGLMTPQVLYCKTSTGGIQPYADTSSLETAVETRGEFLDGSLYADAPCSRLSELFQAQQFIVSQVNPHISPFLTHTVDDDDSKPSLTTKLTKFLHADLVHRLKRLAKMKVIPKIYGQEVTGVWSSDQRYTGDLTLIPKIRTRMLFKPLSHPTDADMREYLLEGERCVWPHICQIQNSMCVERALEGCVKRLMREERGRRKRERGHGDSVNTTAVQSTLPSPSMSPSPSPSPSPPLPSISISPPLSRTPSPLNSPIPAASTNVTLQPIDSVPSSTPSTPSPLLPPHSSASSRRHSSASDSLDDSVLDFDLDQELEEASTWSTASSPTGRRSVELSKMEGEQDKLTDTCSRMDMEAVISLSTTTTTEGV